MLHLNPDKWLPAPAHRVGLRIAHQLRIRWWRLRRPRVVGCRVVAISPIGEVLMIRHSYGSRLWMLPGGGVARGETPAAAALRELREETGCRLDGAREVALTSDIWHGARNEVHVIAGRTADTPCADGREIVAARWFAPAALPPDIGKHLAEHLPVWLAAFAQDTPSE